MTNFVPPPNREYFEKQINELFDQRNGSKDAFAQFLGVNPATISKRLNPYDEKHVSSFYQVVRDIAALRLVSPDLAFDVWKVVSLEIEKLLGFEIRTQGSLAENFKNISDKYGALVKAKVEGQPLNKLISLSADIESAATGTKEELIGMRNRQHFGELDAVN